MIRTNLHSHTILCDGSNSAEDYILSAIKNKLSVYGFSAHAPVSFSTDWCMNINELANYLKLIGELKVKYSNEIEIYTGLEVDFIPGIASRYNSLLKNIKLDYFIGSIHFIDSFSNGEHWNIDTSFELFCKGLKNIFGNNFKNVATRFYDITEQMILEDKPDIIGHIDKIKMFNLKGGFYSESDKWYRERVYACLKTVKRNDCKIELNTRGYYKYNQEDLYPGQLILKMVKELDIPIVLNSDCHHPSEVCKGFEFAIKLLRSNEINHIHSLKNDKWVEMPI